MSVIIVLLLPLIADRARLHSVQKVLGVGRDCRVRRVAVLILAARDCVAGRSGQFRHRRARASAC